MCRIFAYSGELGGDECNAAVTEFAKLAQCGNVPHGIEPGHTDGWGIYASNGGKEVYVRSAGEAAPEKLLTALAPVSGTGQVLIHLRKATIGENKISNTHPFLKNGVAFCHNGSIRSFTQKVTDCEGDTDSEKYFMRILARTDSLGAHDLAEAVEAEVAELSTEDWTSLTCLLKAKDGLVLKYFWNTAHPMSEVGKLNDYYTFYKGTKGSTIILCSEQLEVPGVTWEQLTNGTLLVV